VCHLFVKGEVVRPEEFRFALRPVFSGGIFVFLIIGKARIPFPETVVCDIGINPFSRQPLHVLFRMVAAVRQELRFFFPKHIFFFADFRKAPANAFDHRHQQVMLLAFSEGFRLHDDLMLAVGGGDAVIALDNTPMGLHLGGFVVGDVAFLRLSGFPRFVVVVFEPFFDFGYAFV